MRYILFFFLTTNIFASGELKGMLMSLLQQKLQPKTTRTQWVGQPRPGVENINPRSYLGQGYLDSLNSCPNNSCSQTSCSQTKAVSLNQEKLFKVLSLYPNVTLVRPAGQPLPQKVILILERP